VRLFHLSMRKHAPGVNVPARNRTIDHPSREGSGEPTPLRASFARRELKEGTAQPTGDGRFRAVAATHRPKAFPSRSLSRHTGGGLRSRRLGPSPMALSPKPRPRAGGVELCGVSRWEKGPGWRGGACGTVGPAPVRLRRGWLRLARAGRASPSDRPEGEHSAPNPSPSQCRQDHLPTGCRTSGILSPPMRVYWRQRAPRPVAGRSGRRSPPHYHTTDRHLSLPEVAFRSSGTCSRPS